MSSFFSLFKCLYLINLDDPAVISGFELFLFQILDFIRKVCTEKLYPLSCNSHAFLLYSSHIIALSKHDSLL